jgi:hypothetical protein
MSYNFIPDIPRTRYPMLYLMPEQKHHWHYVEVGKDRSFRNCTLIHAERRSDSPLVKVELEVGLSTVSYRIGQPVIASGDLGIPYGTVGVIKELRHPREEFFLSVLFSCHRFPIPARTRSFQWATPD